MLYVTTCALTLVLGPWACKRNTNVFSWLRNCPENEDGSWRDWGREFQMTGPETVKLQVHSLICFFCYGPISAWNKLHSFISNSCFVHQRFLPAVSVSDWCKTRTLYFIVYMLYIYSSSSDILSKYSTKDRNKPEITNIFDNAQNYHHRTN